MNEVSGRERSALVFGARNLGRAVIETLVAEGWAVAGAARSQATLDGITEAGGLALQSDVTDPASVYATLNEVAAAHGGVDLALNAAAAYGGNRSGPFGGGPIIEADDSGFDSAGLLSPSFAPYPSHSRILDSVSGAEPGAGSGRASTDGLI